MLQVVNRYVDQGVAELVPRVLYIEELKKGYWQVGGVRRICRWSTGIWTRGSWSWS